MKSYLLDSLFLSVVLIKILNMNEMTKLEI